MLTLSIVKRKVLKKELSIGYKCVKIFMNVLYLKKLKKLSFSSNLFNVNIFMNRFNII